MAVEGQGRLAVLLPSSPSSPDAIKGTGYRHRGRREHSPDRIKSHRMPTPRSGQSSKGSAVEAGGSVASTRVPSPMKRLHYPSRWSEWSEKSKTCSAKLPTSPTEDSGTECGQTKLLDVLGMAPLSKEVVAASRARARLAPRLPDYAPEDLEHCTDDCYWRWLVHTLLDEVAELKHSLEDTQGDFQKRAEQRREIETVIGYRDYVLDDLMSMKQSLTKLHSDVPQLRQDHIKLQHESEQLEQRHQSLLAKQQDLRAAIQKSVEWQRVGGRKLQYVEQDCEDGRNEEQEVSDKIKHAQDEMKRLTERVQWLTAERDDLRNEVNVLEEKKEARGKALKQKKERK